MGMIWRFWLFPVSSYSQSVSWRWANTETRSKRPVCFANKPKCLNLKIRVSVLLFFFANEILPRCVFYVQRTLT